MATPPGLFRKIETDLKEAADSLRPHSQMSQDDKTQGSTQMEHTTHKHTHERKRAMEQEVHQNKHQRLDEANDEVYAGLSGPMDYDSRESSDESMTWDEVMSCQQRRE